MSEDFPKASPRQQALTLWIIWFAILSGLFVMAFVAPSGPQGGAGIPPAPEAWAPLSIIGILAAAAGVMFRVLVVPRGKTLQAKLPLMIIGLALCEACGLIGLFLVDHGLPRERIALFWTSLICVLISAPVYANSKAKDSPFRSP